MGTDAASADRSSSAETPEQPDHHHADVSGGWLRAAVFGAMDGLVSNISLVSGVGGGGASAHAVVLAGVAGLVAGAISMALGEYTSVRSQNEQINAELAKERHELQHNPISEQRELAAMLRQRGIAADAAEKLAADISVDPEMTLRIHALEELGVVPGEQPSPWVAAISSFVCFAVGALFPLMSYLCGSKSLALALAIGGAGLFAAGVLVSKFTGRSWWWAGLRQLLLGAAAATATFLIGRLIGVGVSY